MGPRLALRGLHRNQKEGFPLTAYAYGAVYQITARAAMAQNEISKSCEKLAIIFSFPLTKWATSQCINFLKAVPRCVYADKCDTTGPLHLGASWAHVGPQAGPAECAKRLNQKIQENAFPKYKIKKNVNTNMRKCITKHIQ